MDRALPIPSFIYRTVNPPCSKTTSTTSTLTTSWWNLACGTRPVSAPTGLDKSCVITSDVSRKYLGQEEFDRLRSLSYAETHVVMICFSVSLYLFLCRTERRVVDPRRLQVDNPTSLENVETKVIPTLSCSHVHVFEQCHSG